MARVTCNRCDQTYNESNRIPRVLSCKDILCNDCISSIKPNDKHEILCHKCLQPFYALPKTPNFLLTDLLKLPDGNIKLKSTKIRNQLRKLEQHDDVLNNKKKYYVKNVISLTSIKDNMIQDCLNPTKSCECKIGIKKIAQNHDKGNISQICESHTNQMSKVGHFDSSEINILNSVNNINTELNCTKNISCNCIKINNDSFDQDKITESTDGTPINNMVNCNLKDISVNSEIINTLQPTDSKNNITNNMDDNSPEKNNLDKTCRTKGSSAPNKDNSTFSPANSMLKMVFKEAENLKVCFQNGDKTSHGKITLNDNKVHFNNFKESNCNWIEPCILKYEDIVQRVQGVFIDLAQFENPFYMDRAPKPLGRIYINIEGYPLGNIFLLLASLPAQTEKCEVKRDISILNTNININSDSDDIFKTYFNINLLFPSNTSDDDHPEARCNVVLPVNVSTPIDSSKMPPELIYLHLMHPARLEFVKNIPDSENKIPITKGFVSISTNGINIHMCEQPDVSISNIIGHVDSGIEFAQEAIGLIKSEKNIMFQEIGLYYRI